MRANWLRAPAQEQLAGCVHHALTLGADVGKQSFERGPVRLGRGLPPCCSAFKVVVGGLDMLAYVPQSRFLLPQISVIVIGGLRRADYGNAGSGRRQTHEDLTS